MINSDILLRSSNIYIYIYIYIYKDDIIHNITGTRILPYLSQQLIGFMNRNMELKECRTDLLADLDLGLL